MAGFPWMAGVVCNVRRLKNGFFEAMRLRCHCGWPGVGVVGWK